MTGHLARLLGSSLFFAATLLVGCAAQPNANAVSHSSVLTQRSVSSRDAENLASVYHRQAEVLRRVAIRLEAEATFYLQMGADHEWARQSRETANAIWAAAEQADEIAQTYTAASTKQACVLTGGPDRSC